MTNLDGKTRANHLLLRTDLIAYRAAVNTSRGWPQPKSKNTTQQNRFNSFGSRQRCTQYTETQF